MLTTDLISALQTAIGPVILISGVGLFLLTLTNRLGRAIDRARSLAASADRNSPQTEKQIAILWKRARKLRMAILLAAVSDLCAAILIIVLFLTALFHMECAWIVGGLFIGGMTALIFSLLLFIQEVNLSLRALELKLTR